MKHQLIMYVGGLFFLLACQQQETPTPSPEKTYMLAIISPLNQLPFEFEADEAVGDYDPQTGLLRIEAVNMFNGSDKIELRIKEVGDEVVGEYVIGDFDDGLVNARAEFIDGQGIWSVRSRSGNIKITQFVPTEIDNAFWLSATFSFEGTTSGGGVEVTTGEIERAVILKP